MTFNTLISPDSLQQALAQDNPNLRLLDARAKLGEPSWGEEQYRQAHISGAVHADLDTVLSAAPGDGGRHPLPDMHDWLAQIRRWGITNQDQVVVYDDAGGHFAARVWWMMRWVGHEAVAVLDGGLAHWPGPLDAVHLEHSAGQRWPESDFAAQPTLTQVLSSSEAAALIGSSQHMFVDARALPRYLGDAEPIDPVAGHIPGAQCLPSTDNLDAHGRFKTPAELAQRFPASTDLHVVCYCGSGVTAAHNVLSMRIAGVAEPALYAASWSGWITDPERPVATGPESS